MGACTPAPVPADNKSLSAIAHLMDSLENADAFSGSLVISKSDSVVFEAYYGLANRTFNVPVTRDTRFDMASVNKSFVAALVLLACEEGKLALDDKLNERLPFPVDPSLHPEITLHQLLTHTSGLPDYDGVAPELRAHGFARFKRLHFTNQEYAEFIAGLAPVANPGERFYYSNFGYHLLCIVLEEQYQKDFNALLQEKICGPLNMENTFNSIDNEAVFENVATGYQFDENAGEWRKNNFIDLTLGRRIFTTAKDLQQWGAAMLDNRLLSDSSRLMMQTNHLGGLEEKLSYGYGWVVYGPNQTFAMGDLGINTPYIIHGGATEGFKAMLIIEQEEGWIVSLLSNSGNRTNEMELGKKLIHHLLKLKE